MNNSIEHKLERVVNGRRWILDVLVLVSASGIMSGTSCLFKAAQADRQQIYDRLTSMETKLTNNEDKLDDLGRRLGSIEYRLQ